MPHVHMPAYHVVYCAARWGTPCPATGPVSLGGRDRHSAARKSELHLAVAASRDTDCTAQGACQNKGSGRACTHRNNDGHRSTWEAQEVSQRFSSSKGVVSQHQVSLKVLHVHEASQGYLIKLFLD